MLIAPPSCHFFTCGAAEGTSLPDARDAALLAAGLGECCLLRLQAVVPPGAVLVEPRPLPAGALVPAAWARIDSAQPGEVISAAVAVAYPADPLAAGLIVEHAAPGNKEVVEAMARRLAEDAMQRRGARLRDIRSLAVQHRVERLGAVVAGVVLWNDQPGAS